MRVTIQIPIDSKKEAIGIVDAIESYRYLFERPGGRGHIADMMERLLSDNGKEERNVTRQMIEKWFNQKRRMIPSGTLLVTLLAACQIIESELARLEEEEKKAKKAA